MAAAHGLVPQGAGAGAGADGDADADEPPFADLTLQGMCEAACGPQAYVPPHSEEHAWAMAQLDAALQCAPGQALLHLDNRTTDMQPCHLSDLAACAYAVQTAPVGARALLLLTRDTFTEQCAYLVGTRATPDPGSPLAGAAPHDGRARAHCIARVPVVGMTHLFEGSVCLVEVSMDAHEQAPPTLLLTVHDLLALAGKTYAVSREGKGALPFSSFDDRHTMIRALLGGMEAPRGPCTPQSPHHGEAVSAASPASPTSPVSFASMASPMSPASMASPTSPASPASPVSRAHATSPFASLPDGDSIETAPPLCAASSALTLQPAQWWASKHLPSAVRAAHVAAGTAPDVVDAGLWFIPRALAPHPTRPRALAWAPFPVCTVAVAVQFLSNVRTARTQGVQGGQVYNVPRLQGAPRTGSRSAVVVRVYIYDGKQRQDCTHGGVAFQGAVYRAHVVPSRAWHHMLTALYNGVQQSSRKAGGIVPRAKLVPPWQRHHMDMREPQGASSTKWTDQTHAWNGAPCVLVRAALSLHTPLPTRKRVTLPYGGGHATGPTIAVRVLGTARPHSDALTGIADFTRALATADTPLPLHAVWTAIGVGHDGDASWEPIPAWPTHAAAQAQAQTCTTSDPAAAASGEQCTPRATTKRPRARNARR